jgi:plasmid stability protein
MTHALNAHTRDTHGSMVPTVIPLGMAMTLRLTDDETSALRTRADLEHRSMQDVAREAVREYVERHSHHDLVDHVMDTELPRFAEALARLAQ